MSNCDFKYHALQSLSQALQKMKYLVFVEGSRNFNRSKCRRNHTKPITQPSHDCGPTKEKLRNLIRVVGIVLLAVPSLIYKCTSRKFSSVEQLDLYYTHGLIKADHSLRGHARIVVPVLYGHQCLTSEMQSTTWAARRRPEVGPCRTPNLQP